LQPKPAAAKVFEWEAEPRPAPASDKSSPVVTQSARSHHARAIYLADRGLTAEAIEEDRQAIAIEPSHPGHQILMGSLLIENGQLQNALSTYEQVCKRFPDQAEYLEEIVVHLRMGLELVAMEGIIARLNCGQAIPAPINMPTSVMVVDKPSLQVAPREMQPPPGKAKSFMKRFFETVDRLDEF
jgi:tetratricopeptide (TPR) repeat protein